MSHSLCFGSLIKYNMVKHKTERPMLLSNKRKDSKGELDRAETIERAMAKYLLYWELKEQHRHHKNLMSDSENKLESPLKSET